MTFEFEAAERGILFDIGMEVTGTDVRLRNVSSSMVLEADAETIDLDFRIASRDGRNVLSFDMGFCPSVTSSLNDNGTVDIIIESLAGTEVIEDLVNYELLQSMLLATLDVLATMGGSVWLPKSAGIAHPLTGDLYRSILGSPYKVISVVDTVFCLGDENVAMLVLSDLLMYCTVTTEQEVDGETVITTTTTTKNISDILRHLSLKTTSGGDPYIEVDIGFAGLSFGSFGGVYEGTGSEGGSGGGGSSTLQGLIDTTISSPQDGQVLMYDGTVGSITYGQWINADIALTLDDLLDVSAASPAAGAALVYRNSVWTAGALSVADLSDVVTTDVSDGDVLVYNDGVWEPGTVNSSVTNKAADIGQTLTTIATIGNTDITAKISVALSAGSSNGTLKLTVGGVAGSDVPIPGLGSLAFKSAQYIAGTATKDAVSQDALLGVTAICNSITPTTTNNAITDKSYFFWDSSVGEDGAWHFKGNIVADGFGSFGGVNSSSAAGTSLAAVWQSLKTNTAPYQNEKIDSHHIKLGSGLSIDGDGNISASISGTVGVAQGGTGLTSIDAFSLLYAPSNVAMANTLATLAPNTDATKKFLSMTGTGTAGAAPAWSSLAFADIANLASWTGSQGITTLGTIGTGVWQATPIAYARVAPHYIAGTRTIAATAQDILKGIVGICNPVIPETSGNYITDVSYFYWDEGHTAWHFKGNLIAEGYGSFGGVNDEEAEDDDGISVFEGPWTDYAAAYAGYVPTAGIVHSRFNALESVDAQHGSRLTALEARPNIIFVAPAALYPDDADMVENTLYVKLSQTSS